MPSRSFVVSAAVFVGACASEPAPATADGAAKAPAPEASPQPAESTLPDRDPALAHRLVEEGALLLDVRTPQEFALGHVEGARNVPHDQVGARMSEIREWAGDGPIVVYCRSGRRSGIAKEILVDAGLSQVTNLGGMSDW